MTLLRDGEGEAVHIQEPRGYSLAENNTNAATAAQRQPDKLVEVTDTSVRAACGRVSVAVALSRLPLRA